MANSSGFLPSLPQHLCFLLAILFFFTSFIFYIKYYESMLESLMDKLKIGLIVSPLVLLLVVQWYSRNERRQQPLLLVPLPEKDAFHRAGGSPWGVGILLVVLMFMISYQSSFHELWFPIHSR
ncbi:Oxidoreductase/transition metal ion-binding protein [Thalictrum thalictroides]|uniref:Oxidoreductase/transition metal ion-binding protein n=1 Tax=Thalictrum thalictroides TaxID=46969 RepID=A0A7J6W5H0_THATH|nr:Oxidoreductase/transition metal ion-binding protein [Thalictrum thalictroides]